MNLPKLEKSRFDIAVDSTTLSLDEPSLKDIERLSMYKNTKDKDEDVIDRIAKVIASLMGSYDESIESKEAFVKEMSIRQLGLIIDGITNSVKSKKAQAE